MNQGNRWVYAAIAAVLVSACDSTSGPSGPAAATSPLQGKWISNCTNTYYSWPDPPPAASEQIEITIDGNRYSADYKYFEDEDCQTVVGTTQIRGAFAVSDGPETAEGAKPFRSLLVVSGVVPESEDALHYYRSDRGGPGPWALGLPVQLVAPSDIPTEIGMNDADDLDIYKIEKGTLYFGDRYEAGEGHAPEHLDRKLYYTRISAF